MVDGCQLSVDSGQLTVIRRKGLGCELFWSLLF